MAALTRLQEEAEAEAEAGVGGVVFVVGASGFTKSAVLVGGLQVQVIDDVLRGYGSSLVIWFG